MKNIGHSKFKGIEDSIWEDFHNDIYSNTIPFSEKNVIISNIIFTNLEENIRDIFWLVINSSSFSIKLNIGPSNIIKNKVKERIINNIIDGKYRVAR